MTTREVLERCLTEQPAFGFTDRNKMQGAMLIERYLADAGYTIVPIKPTENMIEELARIGDGPMISGAECWGYMLAAASADGVSEDGK